MNPVPDNRNGIFFGELPDSPILASDYCCNRSINLLTSPYFNYTTSWQDVYRIRSNSLLNQE